MCPIKSQSDAVRLREKETHSSFLFGLYYSVALQALEANTKDYILIHKAWGATGRGWGGALRSFCWHWALPMGPGRKQQRCVDEYM